MPLVAATYRMQLPSALTLTRSNSAIAHSAIANSGQRSDRRITVSWIECRNSLHREHSSTAPEAANSIGLTYWQPCGIHGPAVTSSCIAIIRPASMCKEDRLFLPCASWI